MTQEIEKIWPEWKVVERIGSGAYGSVYKAVRSDHNLTSSAAIKVISSPKDASEMESLRSDGMTQDGTRTYLQGIVDDFVNEIQLMETLKGIQNIVSVEDYKVVERTGEIGWDIYIRMELLTPFNDWKGTRTLSEAEVIRLGIDICSALEICEKKQIIHRDIKPENIFINEFGFFKLGDFGIARKLSGTRGGQSIKGTYNYMAPEVASGTNYDGRVDIYSLGIVLYRLLNNDCLPFVPSQQLMLDQKARTDALNRRLRGDALPAPVNASRDLANLVLCACAHNPDARFRSAAVMKRALQNLQSGAQPARPAQPAAQPAAAAAPRVRVNTRSSQPQPRPAAQPADEKTTRIVPGPAPAAQPQSEPTMRVPQPQPQPEPAPETGKKGKKAKKEKKKKKGGKAKWILLLILVLLIAAAAVVVPSLLTDNGESIPLIGGAISEANAENARKQDIESILADAATYADAGDYTNALRTLSGGLNKYPEDAELTAKQTEYTEALAAKNKQDALDQAAQYAAAGDYKSALETVQEAQKLLGSDADFLQKTAEYTESYKSAALETAAQYEKTSDYLNAYKTIQTAMDLVGSDSSLNVKLSLYAQNYASAVAAQADEKIAAKDFAGARTLLTNALKELPGNATLTAKMTQVSSSQPVSLSTLSVLNGGWDWNATAPEDPFGNDYSDAVNYVVLGDDYWRSEQLYSAEYRVYGNYSSMTFNLVPYKDTATEGTGYVQIYADDVLVQTSPVIGQKTDQLTVTASIAGAEYLKIVVHTQECGMIIVSDVQLWP